MRLSTHQVHQSALQDMLRINREVADTQEQIASGRRLVRASDNPSDAAKIVTLRRELAELDTFVRNTEAIEAELAREESVLDQVIEVIQRVQELVVQAGGGTLTQEDRGFIAVEVQARMDELTELMNSRGADGRFIFAGGKGDTQPFVVEGQDVRYEGDESQRSLQIDTGLFVPFSDSGRALFVDIPSATTNFEVERGPDNAAEGVQIRRVGVVDQTALDDFAPDGVVIEFRPLTEAGGAVNYTVRRLSDNRVVGGAENVAFTAGQPIEIAGMQVAIDGVPESGDRFAVRTTSRQSLLETVGRAARDLQRIDESAAPEAFQAAINSAIENLSNAQSNVLQARSDIGARLNTVAATRGFHEEQQLASEALISEVRDLDYAEAVSRLSFQSFVLEAAQQSFVRVSRLSLFNAL